MGVSKDLERNKERVEHAMSERKPKTETNHPFSEKAEPKRDCNAYPLCFNDEDWRPSHCENCGQYHHKKTEAERIAELEAMLEKVKRLFVEQKLGVIGCSYNPSIAFCVHMVGHFSKGCPKCENCEIGKMLGVLLTSEPESMLKYWIFRIDKGERLRCNECKRLIFGKPVSEDRPILLFEEAIRSDNTIGECLCVDCAKKKGIEIPRS